MTSHDRNQAKGKNNDSAPRSWQWTACSAEPQPRRRGNFGTTSAVVPFGRRPLPGTCCRRTLQHRASILLF